MDYINFGNAGVKVSRIALGLGLRGQSDESTAQRLVEHAIEKGITFIDCANIYGPLDDRANIGRSEVVVGRALAGKRDRVVLTSKVAGNLGPYDAWQVCRSQWISDTIDAASYICVQNQYNLLKRDLEREMFGLIRDRGLGAMAYSPLAIGLLSGAYERGVAPLPNTIWGSGRLGDYEAATAGHVGETMSAVIDIASKLDKTPAQVSIAWILSHPEITCAISGADLSASAGLARGGGPSVGWPC